ncbi:MAG: App1 family protein [Galactobacter sp.]|uniref:App1 family protein n=1 Tax=Galactobacter sp. TaxID=2676125 RepID=UPI0025C52A02|nr:phosphatase domain-containing protein [Galactobacter sp.]
MPTPQYSEPLSGLALSIEDSWHAFRLNQARRRGWNITVLPYRGYGLSGDNGWIRVLGRVVMSKPGRLVGGRHLPDVVADGIRGWRNFVSPTVLGATVDVTVGDLHFTVTADRGGVLDERLAVNLAPGWQKIVLCPRDEDGNTSDPVTSSVFVVDSAQTHGVICDVDDTVVVTALPRPMLAAWNSFVLDEHARNSTPGMPVLLDRITRDQPMAPTLYLSTGAWNVNLALTRFLARNMYPDGPLLLTDWGPTEGRVFRSGTQHKVDRLRRLAEEFPHISWLLIGDDGQHDPEIYAEFARRYPDNVRAIVIRQLSPSQAVLAGGRSEGIMGSTPGIPWVYASDGGRIAQRLEALGLLTPPPQLDADIEENV